MTAVAWYSPLLSSTSSKWRAPTSLFSVSGRLNHMVSHINPTWTSGHTSIKNSESLQQKLIDSDHINAGWIFGFCCVSEVNPRKFFVLSSTLVNFGINLRRWPIELWNERSCWFRKCFPHSVFPVPVNRIEKSNFPGLWKYHIGYVTAISNYFSFVSMSLPWWMALNTTVAKSPSRHCYGGEASQSFTSIQAVEMLRLWVP